MMTKMYWQVNEVYRYKTGDAEGMNVEVDSRDEMMHIWMSDV